MDFRHCIASTMFPLSQLQCLVIGIPTDENALSLETDDTMTDKQSLTREACKGPPAPSEFQDEQNDLKTVKSGPAKAVV